MYNLNASKAVVVILYRVEPGSAVNPAEDIIHYSAYVNYCDSIRADLFEKNICTESSFFGNIIPTYQEKQEVILIKL